MDDRTTIADLERRLTASETRHRLLIQSWAQAEWETDADGVVVADSSSWRAYTGQTLEEWLGYGWLNAIHPDDRAFAERQWRDATAARRPVDAEFRLRAPDGVWRWTNVRAAPVLDEAGNIEKWAGINIDIDDRKRAEAALRESEERYRAVFDSIDEGFVEMEMFLGDDGQIIDWRWIDFNPAFERMSGLKGKKGQLFSEVVPELEPEWAERYGHVIATGETLRFELPVGGLDSWFDAFVSRIGGEGSRRLVVVFNNITARKRAEEALRESEKRQAFLLKLSDVLRPLTDISDIEKAATRLLGEHLKADRCFLSPVYEDGLGMYVREEYLRLGASSVLGDYTFAQFGEFVGPELHAGQVLAVEDVAALTSLSASERASYAAVEIGAYLLIPLVRDERLAAFLTINHRTTRAWSDADKAVARQTADRLWAARERGRAEEALRESEERFAQFAASSSDGLWVRDAATLTMEYVSPAIATIYGVAPDALLGDPRRWAALIVPEDRDVALDHLDQARGGEAVTHEFRIQRPADGAFRWIRNTDFPLRSNGDVPRIGGIAEDVTEAKLAAEHQGVLLAELQHRVRNIMAQIRAITARTAERAENVPDYAALMMGRLLAFARVQALLTRAANVSVGLRHIVHDEVGAQAANEGQYTLDGPDLALAPKAAEVLTLAIHELTTNALKYGALSVPEGRITVTWATFERRGTPWLGFDWSEAGAPERAPPDPSAPSRRGFGSELIEGRVPYELGGRGRVTIEPGGARCRLEFPLRDGASILETDAPRQATVFGGAIDMTGQADLGGHRILVVEDDYYLATDTARAMRGAGAEVLGPCPSEAAARDEIVEIMPTGAVLDINLGDGPSFALAGELRARGVPFVFVTGYDPGVIPTAFTDVERVQKPVDLKQVVGALAKVLGVPA